MFSHRKNFNLKLSENFLLLYLEKIMDQMGHKKILLHTLNLSFPVVCIHGHVCLAYTDPFPSSLHTNSIDRVRWANEFLRIHDKYLPSHKYPFSASQITMFWHLWNFSFSNFCAEKILTTFLVAEDFFQWRVGKVVKWPY